MQTLADMGRVFNDEDEAKLVKLTEDLTNWMNKWAPTFEDPESILFEITTPLVTDDMLVQPPVETKTVEEEIVVPAEPTEEPVPEPVEEPVVEPIAEELPFSSGISISFSFGDNGDWFTFEQVIFPEEGQEETIEINFDNVWAEMTQGLKELDDWSRLNSEQWDSLIDFQFLDDQEIDAILNDWFSEPFFDLDPEFKDFIDSLDHEDVLEFTPEEINQLFDNRTPDEIKTYLDKIDNFEQIVQIFKMLNDKQLFRYFTGLSEDSWVQTTPEEWRSYIVFMDSVNFKQIVDEMETEDIFFVWQFFDDWMT